MAITSANSSSTFGTSNQPYYTWKVLSVGSNFVRVQSTGEVGSTTSALYAKKVVTADITGGLTRNFLDYAYYSTYETLSSAYIQKQFLAGRSISLDNAATLAAAGVSGSPSSVTWSGPPTSGATGSQWCDSLYYSPASGAATVNAATGGLGRYFQGSGLPSGYNWQESVTAAPGASALVGSTHNGICQVDFTTGTKITGPAYSRDAYLLSYGYNNGTTHGAGPEFDNPAYSAWSTSDSPAANPPWLAFPVVGGDTRNGANEPVSAGFTLSLPTTVSSALTSNSATQVCTYNGPTRVYVQGGTATITSPLTAVGTDVCTKNVSTTATGTGVVSAQVPVANTLIYVKNVGSSSLWSTASGTNPIFAVTTAGSTTTVPGATTDTATDAAYAPATGQNPSTKTDGAWTPQWTSYSTGTTCNTSTAGTDLKFFNCYVPKVSHTPAFSDSYSSVKYSVQNALATSPSSYTTAAQLNTLVNSFLSGGNTSDAANSTPSTTSATTSHRWVVATTADSSATDGCTPGSTSSTGTVGTVAAPTTDPLYQNTATGSSTPVTTTATTCLTATVSLQVPTCSLLGLLGACVGTWGWGNGSIILGGSGGGISQFKVTETSKSPSTTTTITPSTQAFPNSSDITKYATWDASKADAPGDAYVEGTVTGKLSVVAENDIVDTGNLSYTTPGTDATDLVAANNVRAYHPVSCVDTTLGVTTSGYCPNDTTGLSPKGSLQFTSTNFSAHPSRQYANLRSDLANLTVSAAIYSLAGSFVVDNYDRGDGYNPTSTGGSVLAADGLNALTVTGGVYEVHHGAAGVSWEIANTATGRPTSGYVETINWDSTLKNRSLPYAPSPSGTNSTSTWQIIGISAGSGT